MSGINFTPWHETNYNKSASKTGYHSVVSATKDSGPPSPAKGLQESAARMEPTMTATIGSDSQPVRALRQNKIIDDLLGLVPDR